MLKRFGFNVCVNRVKQKQQKSQKKSSQDKQQFRQSQSKMMRKNQLKRLSLQKLEQYSKSTTNGQAITMVQQVITQRNDQLRQKTSQLRSQIQKVRKQTRKTIKQMNQAVRDRLQKKQKIIMDKNSRPTHEDIKNLADLYTYIENQTSIIDRNNKSIDELLQSRNSYSTQIQSSFENPQEKFTQLDHQYQRLYNQCIKEQQKLNVKTTELTQFQTHVNNIHKSIEQYRVKYENVESVIRQRQRELDRLVTYYNTRKQQDQENINREKRLTNVIENELLKTQSIYNANTLKNQHLQILEIQKQLHGNTL